MERGPMALFGAIVAVGLGPAMWLGAQFGSTDTTPTKPPSVSSEHQGGPTQTQGAGQGAGAAPQDPSIVLETRPKANDKPLHRDPSTSRSPSRSATPTPSTDPSGTGKPKPSDGPSTPPTESTTDPSGGGQGGNPGPGGGGDAPPSPPEVYSGGSGETQYATDPAV
jgi:hypothetical protein